MADRGRDFKVSFLSDTTQFDAAKPATDLEDLADAADKAGRQLDKLDAATAARDLERVGREAHDAQGDLDKLGDEAKDTATRVDTAFDKIARSSRTNLRDKIDGDVGKVKGKLREVGDEARDTAREMFASFTNAGSLTDAAQEISANAGALFGPIGLAIGGALSAGIAIFQTQAEEAKAKVGEVFDALVDGQGKLESASVDTALQKLARDGDLDKLATQARDASINVQDLQLAVAGDPDAISRVRDRMDELRGAMREQSEAAGDGGLANQQLWQAVQEVENRLGPVSGALDEARKRYQDYSAAASAGKDATAAAAKEMATNGTIAAEGFARKIRDGASEARDAAAAVRAGVAAEISKPLPAVVIPIQGDPRPFYAQLQTARNAAKLAIQERLMP